jgi:NNP family nitrate/nitrite transporter-like MFS transporter
MRTEESKAWMALTMNTLAFTICFACWMMNGVLVTYLVSNDVFQWNNSQMGWIIGMPVLTGALTRLPLGILTDKYGGRNVFSLLMLFSAAAMIYISYANTYIDFLVGGCLFGVTGGSFAVGIAYTSIWFKKEKQGLALGIFGAGNAGAALTSMGAPFLLNYLTSNGADLDQWRSLPKVYAAALLLMTIVFYLFTTSKKAPGSEGKSLKERLQPLKCIRVHRFGFYYFFVFGGFVALSQWLIPYYVNVYKLPVTTAGLMAAIFSLPSGVIRALGGWMSDHYGARKVMYWVFSTCLIVCSLLIIPQMDIHTPGKGIQAKENGTVTAVENDRVIVKNKKGVDKEYSFIEKKSGDDESFRNLDEVTVWPEKRFWQEATVAVGDTVHKKQLLVKGITHVFFQANVWIFTGLVFIIGIMMGIGKAAVYKHIPEYFENDVGVVGGVVGVIGGLGGFVCPIIFGYLLSMTGFWSTCWLFLAIVVGVCLWWMHHVIQKMMQKEVPSLMRQMDQVKGEE